MRRLISAVFVTVLSSGCGSTSEVTPQADSDFPSSGTRPSQTAPTGAPEDRPATAQARALARLRNRIADATKELSAHGVEVAGVKTDSEARVVVVIVSSNLEEARRTLDRRWPGEPLRVVGGTVGF